MATLYERTKMLYDYMVEHSTVDEDNASLRWYTGPISTVAMRELEMDSATYAKVINAIKTSGVAEQTQRGGGRRGSTWVIYIDNPLTEDSFDRSKRVRSLNSAQQLGLSDQLSEMERQSSQHSADIARHEELITLLAKQQEELTNEIEELSARIGALEAASNNDSIDYGGE